MKSDLLWRCSTDRSALQRCRARIGKVLEMCTQVGYRPVESTDWAGTQRSLCSKSYISFIHKCNITRYLLNIWQQSSTRCKRWASNLLRWSIPLLFSIKLMKSKLLLQLISQGRWRRLGTPLLLTSSSSWSCLWITQLTFRLEYFNSRSLKTLDHFHKNIVIPELLTSSSTLYSFFWHLKATRKNFYLLISLASPDKLTHWRVKRRDSSQSLIVFNI